MDGSAGVAKPELGKPKARRESILLSDGADEVVPNWVAPPKVKESGGAA